MSQPTSRVSPTADPAEPPRAAPRSAGELTTTLVMGQVVLFHVLEEVAAKSPSGKTIVDIAKYRPMTRLGGNFYGCVNKARAVWILGHRPGRERDRRSKLAARVCID